MMGQIYVCVCVGDSKTVLRTMGVLRLLNYRENLIKVGSPFPCLVIVI